MTHVNTASTQKQLVVLGCSATKVATQGALPAITLYDGPTFRVFRSFLRDYYWPQSLSVAVLSAKYGIIGGLSQITTYDQRMTSDRAAELARTVSKTLQDWSNSHSRIDLVLGQDYLHSIEPQLFSREVPVMQVVAGAIGRKLSRLHDMLHALNPCKKSPARNLPEPSRPLYFLPDWDDFLDVDFDFEHDKFSSPERAARHEEHSITLMRPQRLCDGVLVSLAQNLGSKGLLKRVGISDQNSLSPRSVRAHFKLRDDQWAFGDCGAFSYVSEEKPTVSVEQAVALYDLYAFDLGASVDHIPVAEFATPRGKITLSEDEQRRRVTLTRDNAEQFLKIHRERRARFIPVGVIQGLDAQSYAKQVGAYVDMGYRHIAIGGLVPRSDAEVLGIVRAIQAEAKRGNITPWIHLLGIFRPALQSHFRALGIGGFDSASYFRKAWLRADQNYLGVDGRWYTAIRIPPLNDPRTKKRLQASSGLSDAALQALESKAMGQLRAYDRGKTSIDAALEAVCEYDPLLLRSTRRHAPLQLLLFRVCEYDPLLLRSTRLDTKTMSAYRTTLERRPWRACKCPMCTALGIEIVIFRGINRNKRRGAHNTMQLFQTVQGGAHLTHSLAVLHPDREAVGWW